MAYSVLQCQKEYGPRAGLEGPFRFANGQVLYYDPREGQYWDPKTDFYVEPGVVSWLQQGMVDLMSR